METPLTIGIFTDVHFGRDVSFRGKPRKVGHRAPEVTRRFVQAMNQDFKPDLILQLGDVVQDMTLQEDLDHYALCCDILKDLDAPIYHVAGNHDLIKMSEDDLLGLWRTWAPHLADTGVFERGHPYYTFQHQAWQIIVLQSHERKDDCVWMDQPQIQWLARTLDEATAPVLICVHHSLADQDTTDNWWFGQHPHLALIRERVQIRDLIARSGKVQAVLNGHLHWNQRTDHDGIPYITVQSPIENFDNAEPPLPSGAWGQLTLTPSTGVLEVVGRDAATWRWDHET